MRRQGRGDRPTDTDRLKDTVTSIWNCFIGDISRFLMTARVPFISVYVYLFFWVIRHRWIHDAKIQYQRHPIWLIWSKLKSIGARWYSLYHVLYRRGDRGTDWLAVICISFGSNSRVMLRKITTKSDLNSSQLSLNIG